MRIGQRIQRAEKQHDKTNTNTDADIPLKKGG